ncbi:MAG: hypothetical protein L0216_18495 [Planctomycetales bacterium]|nr:hypothetical protein [Planctomycetales bacterium]
MTWVPFALHGFRVALLGLMLCVPRRYPWRAPALISIFLAEVALDIVDGIVARRLGSAPWRLLWWSDHLADLAFFLGAALIWLTGLSFFPGPSERPERLGAGSDPPGAPGPAPPRHARTAETVLWTGLLVALGAATLVLMLGRAFLLW